MKIKSIFFILISALSVSAQKNNVLLVKDFSNSLFKQARLIGIGESAHEVQVYHDIQIKILKDRIKSHQLKNIYLEMGTTGTESISKYISTCDVQYLKDSFKRTFIGSYSASFVQFFQWLCHYNQSNKTPIKIYGVDLYSNPWDVFSDLKTDIYSLLSKSVQNQFMMGQNNCWAASQVFQSWSEFTKTKEYIDYAQTGRLDPLRMKACLSSMTHLKSYLMKNKSKIISIKGSNIWIHSILKIQSTLGLQKYWEVQKSPDFSARDFSIAENILFLQRHFPKQHNAAFLAHNVHVTYHQDDSLWFDWGNNFKSAGHFLKKNLGADYVALSISGYNITGKDGLYLNPTESNSIDLFVFNQQSQVLAFNSEDPIFNSNKKWWLHNENNPQDKNGVLIDVKKSFSGYISVLQSPAAQSCMTYSWGLSGDPSCLLQIIK